MLNNISTGTQNRALNYALVAWFCLLNLQTLTVTGWSWDVFSDLNQQQAIKVYHVFGAALMLWLIARSCKIPRQPWIVFGLFAAFFLFSSVTFLWNGFNPLIINYIFAYCSFLIGMKFAKLLAPDAVLRRLQAGLLLIIAGILVKTWIFRDALISFIRFPFNGHPDMPLYFYGGGPNLEASWIALSTSLFLGTRLFLPVLGFAFALSAAYASRTGALICLLSGMVALVRSGRKKALVCGLVLASLVGAAAITPSSDIYVISRFISIGTDPGSTGRLGIWAGVWDAFLDSPILGHGAGNGIAAVERALNTRFFEANLHNYYAQVLLDFGLPVLCVYLLLVIAICVKEIRVGFDSRLGAYLVLFFVACLLEYRGAEAITWFVFGLYLHSNPVSYFPKWFARPARTMSLRHA